MTTPHTGAGCGVRKSIHLRPAPARFAARADIGAGPEVLRSSAVVHCECRLVGLRLKLRSRGRHLSSVMVLDVYRAQKIRVSPRHAGVGIHCSKMKLLR